MMTTAAIDRAAIWPRLRSEINITYIFQVQDRNYCHMISHTDNQVLILILVTMSVTLFNRQ